MLCIHFSIHARAILLELGSEAGACYDDTIKGRLERHGDGDGLFKGVLRKNCKIANANDVLGGRRSIGLAGTFFPCLRAFPLRRPPPLLGWLGGPYKSPGLKPAAFAVDASHDAIASVSFLYSRYVLMRTLGSIVTFCDCFNTLLVSARCGRAKGPRLQSGNLRRGRGVTSLDGTGVIRSN